MSKCLVDGCSKEAKSRGYCQTHYMRLHRHGSVDAGRPQEYGTKANHPMYITWMSAKRGKRLCDEWAADFWKFLQDVSPVPEGNWRIHRKVKDLPYSKENVEWKPVLVTKERDESVSSYQSRRKKVLYRPTQTETREKNLRQNHGMAVGQYEKMMAEQGGVCAICGKPETKVGGVNKILMPLSVDHCHKTRQGGGSKGIRGLLCQACNIGLGKFDDDPDLLRKAAAYLEKYRA